jgi:septum site-determining protein MinC
MPSLVAVPDPSQSRMPFFSSSDAADAVSPSFEIKSTRLTSLALMIKTSNLTKLCQDLVQQYGQAGENPEFFDQNPVVIDVSLWMSEVPAEDLTSLLAVLKACRLVPVALRGAHEPWFALTQRLGLAWAEPEPARSTPEQAPTPVVVPPVLNKASAVPRAAAIPTMVIDKPLRSGQKVYARGCDLVVLAMVNQGAEVVADGNIHVYAPLRGKAMAGASGNVNARIFSLSLEPELISIAGVYRTSENPLPANVQGKPAQVQLSNDGQDKLLINALTITY